MTKNNKLGYAVVGLGIGMAHIDAVLSLKDEGKAELVAVCDIREDRLSVIREKYPSLKIYTVFEEMLKDEEIDIVSICLPSGMHAVAAVAAMEAGKHVLLEKPIDISVEAALQIEEARKRTGMKCGNIYQNRNHAVMTPLRKAMSDGSLGKIFLGTFAVKWYRDADYYSGDLAWHGTWAMDGGGSLINQAVHTLDLMQWLLGTPISVTSTTEICGHDIETEDLTASLFKFEGGVTATFVSSTCCYPGLTTDIQIYGTKGAVELDNDVLKRWVQEGMDERDQEDMMDRYGKGNRVACKLDGTRYGHVTQVADIIDAVLEDRDPQVMPMESIKTIRIIEAVYRSARTGKTVYFN